MGICLGMQLMTQGSEEGIQKGLGWINARVENSISKKIMKISGYRIWDGTTRLVFARVSLWREMPDETRFYYVHSYCLKDIHVAHALLTADWGKFLFWLRTGEYFGVQFHPEKVINLESSY
ncbi:MAG: hypothetical protein IPK03_01860 [Bacteroidetes bacterium]|nr:hypothetical protein [Bacteroidota bacterium]